MKEEDIKHLELVYRRMMSFHGEDREREIMIKFKSIIDDLKPPMPEVRRWRLEIPEEVPREYMEGRTGLYVLNGAEVELMTIMTGDGTARIRAGKYQNMVHEHCPRSWLVEIPTDKHCGMQSFEEWMSKTPETDGIRSCTAEDLAGSEFPFDEHKTFVFNRKRIIRLIELSAKNEALKHRETESRKDAYNRLGQTGDYMVFCQGWNSSLKSRGYA